MTDKLREAAQLALEALDNMTDSQSNPARRNFPTIHDYGKSRRAADTLRAALAQQDAQAVVQEPCAVVKWQTGGPVVHIIGDVQAGDLLYRAAPTPPARSVEAQAVRDGIDAAINFLESGDDYEVKRKIMAAALRCSGLIFDLWWRAAPTPPAQRVMLTDEEIDEVWNSIAGHSIYAEYQMEIANAMIEAYERKNGIK